MKRLLFLLLLFSWALSGMAQYGFGEGEYYGVTLSFHGRLLTPGTCQRVAEDTLRCQVVEGGRGTLELTATRTPPGPVDIRLASAPPGWPGLPVSSGWGTVRAQYRFTVPRGTAGGTYELVFEAWTAGVPYPVKLKVILQAVAPTAPPEEEGIPGYRSDERGRFSIPVEELPNTTVTGTLTRCGVQPLPGVPVSVELLPKAGREWIRDLGDVGAVRVSSPGYGQAVVKEFNLLSSMDITGRVQRTIDLGVVCLPPTVPPTRPITPSPPLTPTGPIEGTTDADGKFSLPLPGLPGTTVTGRLTECGQRPLPEQDFSLTPIWEEGEVGELAGVAGFTVAVPRYEPVTVSKFGRISIFGRTTYLLGDVVLCPTLDLLPWDKNRPLTWDDFRGKPENGGQKEAASIYYRLEVKYQPKARKTKEGKWKAEIEWLKVENVMDRSKSWVLPNCKTPALLKHEQGHFDINEVYRRILEARLKELVAEAATEEQATEELRRLIQETFALVWNKAEEVQKEYDRETEHGTNQDKQAEWEKKIRKWLDNPKQAPQP